jgi:predicted nucleic acid-binding protein
MYRIAGETKDDKPLSVPAVYVDTNIFLNVWFEEMLKFSPAFYYSRRILDLILECRFRLVVSDLTVKELSRKTGLTRELIVQEYLRPFEIVGKLTVVEATVEMIQDANAMSHKYGLHGADSFHVLVAKREGCVLVTRDTELRTTAKKVGIKVALPEELI